VDHYVEEYRARGICAATIGNTAARLDSWGRWLKQRRPRVSIERINAELITRYIESCSSFRAKSTVYGTLSTMRGFGVYLVRHGLWTVSPLRWMKGPKVTPYSRLPKRIDQAHMEALWQEAARRGGDYGSHLWVAVLAMLYGTGLRRGQLERLNVDSFRSSRGDAAHRWQEDGARALRPVATDGAEMPSGVFTASPQPTRAMRTVGRVGIARDEKRRSPDRSSGEQRHSCDSRNPHHANPYCASSSGIS
jgi:site-specific recombinase XerD